MTWTYGNALAIIVGDLSVRIWDMETSDNFLLPLEVVVAKRNASLSAAAASTRKPKSGTTTSGTGSSVEIFTCLAYSNLGHTICAGTSHGNLFSWHKTSNYEATSHADDDDDDVTSAVGARGGVVVAVPQWQLNNVSNVRGAIKQCGWGLCDVVTPCILLNCITNVYVMKEQPLITFHGQHVTALQRTAHQIALECTAINGDVSSSTSPSLSASPRLVCTVQSEIPVTDLVANAKFLVLTNGRRIVAYQLVYSGEAAAAEERMVHLASSSDSGSSDSLAAKQVGTFNAPNQRLLLYDDKVITMDGECVRILSMGSGVVLQELGFKAREGCPIGIDLNQAYLTVFTMNGYVHLYDVARHEPRPICPPSGSMRTGYDLVDNFGEFIAIKASASGTHLCMLIATENLLPDGKLYLWHLQEDHLSHFDFFDVARSDKFFTKLPVNFHWDRVDQRLLAVEVKCIQQRGGAGAGAGGAAEKLSKGGGRVVAESQVLVMFVAEKAKQLNELEVIRLAPGEQLVNLCVPHVVSGVGACAAAAGEC